MSAEPGLVRVEWQDARFDLDAVPSLALVETVGWLVRDGHDALSVAAERIDGEAWRAVTTIPRCCVHDIVPLMEEWRA